MMAGSKMEAVTANEEVPLKHYSHALEMTMATDKCSIVLKNEAQSFFNGMTTVRYIVYSRKKLTLCLSFHLQQSKVTKHPC